MYLLKCYQIQSSVPAENILKKEFHVKFIVASSSLYTRNSQIELKNSHKNNKTANYCGFSSHSAVLKTSQTRSFISHTERKMESI